MLLKSCCLECHIDASWIKWCHLALLTIELGCSGYLAPQLCHFFWPFFGVCLRLGREKGGWKFTCFLETEISSSFIFRVLINTYSLQFLLCWIAWTQECSIFSCLLWIRANQVERKLPPKLRMRPTTAYGEDGQVSPAQPAAEGAVVCLWDSDSAGRAVPVCSLCSPGVTDWGWPRWSCVSWWSCVFSTSGTGPSD